MRVSLVMVRPVDLSKGTLKSTRTNTRLPATGSCSSVRNAMSFARCFDPAAAAIRAESRILGREAAH